MNNWFLKFFLLGFVALALGMLASLIASLFFHAQSIQKGIGFLSAGVGVVAIDLAVRKIIDVDGVYQEVYLLPFVRIRIPAWIFGVIIAVGGIVILSSDN